MKKPGLIVILVLMLGSGALVTLGKMDQKTDLSAVLEMWGDALRDGDQVTLQATRVSDAREMRFGHELGQRMPPDDPTWTPYVNTVGQSLVPNVRRQAIRYQFHVIDNPDVNAFAIPGGHIFVFTGLLRFLASEAELATILGHEISHVDQRHCIEKFQYELAARRVGLDGIGQIAEIVRLPITIAYQKNQEIEADAQGARLSIQAGYDPSVAPVLFSRMQAAFGGPATARAATPQGELAGTLVRGLADYFHSHPSSQERSERLAELITNNRRSLAGKTVYVGVSNYQERMPRTQREDPGERRVY
jgi:predicted Zn-dependent protease